MCNNMCESKVKLQNVCYFYLQNYLFSIKDKFYSIQLKNFSFCHKWFMEYQFIRIIS